MSAVNGLAAPGMLTLAAAALVVGQRFGSVPGRGVTERARWLAEPFDLPVLAGSLRRIRQQFRPDAELADLALALDLLACALRAGAPPSRATSAVAAAVRGPVGRDLLAVARATDLGAPPDIAWQPLGQLIGVAAVARTAARSAESGTRLADELAGIAADLRARRAAAADASVRRAGVLVVLPLGLCFLPAFVLIGVLPIVIGVAGSVLR